LASAIRGAATRIVEKIRVLGKEALRDGQPDVNCDVEGSDCGGEVIWMLGEVLVSISPARLDPGKTAEALLSVEWRAVDLFIHHSFDGRLALTAVFEAGDTHVSVTAPLSYVDEGGPLDVRYL